MAQTMTKTKFAIESEDKEAASAERLVTVKLLRDYVPASSEPDVVFEEQGMGKRAKDVRTEIFAKVPAGSVVELPLSEAKALLEDRIFADSRKDASGQIMIERPAVAKITLDMV